MREEKAKARLYIKERLAHVQDRDRYPESRSLCKQLLKLLPKEPVHICAYFPLKDEADIRPLLPELLKRGCTLYLPRFAEKKLTFHRADDLDALKPGAFGIPEPLPTAPQLRPEDLQYALVPARAYDRGCNRLGRGNGGYDIWIRGQRKVNPTTVFWGVILEVQLINQVPMEAHDEIVDAVITARSKIDHPARS